MKIHEDYLRSLMFGIQDGIISITGVVVGVSAGVGTKSVIIIAGLVAVIVDATSMAAGFYTSEKAVHQLDKHGKHTDSLVIGSVIMFLSYIIGGSIPIIPTILFNQPFARYVAIASSLTGLALLGYMKGKYVEHHALKSAVEQLIFGGIATLLGLIVGLTLKQYGV